MVVSAIYVFHHGFANLNRLLYAYIYRGRSLIVINVIWVALVLVIGHWLLLLDVQAVFGVCVGVGVGVWLR